ncbi:MAG: hypothetical protein K8S98_16805 [Planctomycetes bacterium]|nr:hypothetical protein [Planctomycetota bacterium]
MSMRALAVQVLAGVLSFSATVDAQITTGVASQSVAPVASSDARIVAFASFAANLVPSDTNGVSDVFVHDRQTGVTTRVSVDGSGTEANGASYAPSISADGRYVAFESFASNLVAGDANGARDIFVHDRQLGTTTRVSLGSGGAEANGESVFAALSADGRFVAFESFATNLVAGDVNGKKDVFVHDRQTATTVRVSVTSSGGEATGASEDAALSADGRFVVFTGYSDDLVPGDTNGNGDVFLHDLQTGATNRVSVGTGGTQGNFESRAATISADGTLVAFQSVAVTLVAGDTNGFNDVFVRDVQAGTTTRVSVSSSNAQANAPSIAPVLSSSGGCVVFSSYATNLVFPDANGAADVFVRDLQTGTTTRVSVDSGGNAGNGDSTPGGVSDDQRFVTFMSFSTNLVPPGQNFGPTSFVHDRAPLACPAVATYCVSKQNSQNCLALVSTTGACSASAASGFSIRADLVVPNKSGLFFYSTVGATETAFQAGFLCVKPPIKRTFVQNSGGSAQLCSGVFTIDFNAYIASGVDPALVAGAQFWGQFWHRDPLSASHTGLTHAVTTVICP